MDIKPYLSPDVNQEDSYNYKLYGVLVHHGYNCHSGHYYSFIKASNGLWYKMDDSRVEQTTENQVLNQSAYILFYTRESDNDESSQDNESQLIQLQINQIKTPQSNLKQIISQTKLQQNPQSKKRRREDTSNSLHQQIPQKKEN